MKKPLYDCKENDKVLIKGQNYIVSATKGIKKENGYEFQTVYLYTENGKDSLYVPANLIVMVL